jgi:hypothetical protein
MKAVQEATEALPLFDTSAEANSWNRHYIH